MSAADAVGKLPKPLMRGLMKSQIKKNLSWAFAVTFGSVVLWKIFVNDDHKRRYANFYKNYDIDKEFETMRKKGVFESATADDD